eukprot:CAMPEP_0204823456 /NCGR_PEP_ID=MMETSP1346-20131115/1519_1 /ASSEMBLY_ACC=CAM_ASM_000771 /TAXON_ID=215587 /ORGANISM="Aplanochytrium stocchinoi, Strain GSBS06" /LENGTH=385 /DNA_ID=CAMNT_0051950095 /DNA_START=30 /DNA_END=1184 /DNA_ORIENTATION=-
MTLDLKATLNDMKESWKSPKQVSRIAVELNNVKIERRKLREQLVRKAELLASVQTKVKVEKVDEEKSKEKLRKYEFRIKSAEQDAANKEKLLRISRDKLEDLLKEKAKLDADCDSLRTQNKQLAKDKSILRGKLGRLEFSRNFQEIETENSKQQANENENDRSKANMKIRSLQHKSNKFKREAKKLQKALEQQNILLEQKEESIVGHQKHLEYFNIQIQTKEKRIQSLVHEIDILKEKFESDTMKAISGSSKIIMDGIVHCLCQILDEWVAHKEQQIENEQRDKILNESGELDSVAKIINWSTGDVCDVLGVELKNNDPDLLNRIISSRQAVEKQKAKLRSEISSNADMKINKLRNHNEAYIVEVETIQNTLQSLLSDTFRLLTL